MSELRKYTGRLTVLSRIVVRDEEVVDGGVVSSLAVGDAEDPTPSTVGAATKHAPFKMSGPVVIGIVSIGLIVIGLGEFGPSHISCNGGQIIDQPSRST
jgi:hypothetical protein